MKKVIATPDATKAMALINAHPAQDLAPVREMDEARRAWVVPGLGDWLKNIYASEVLPEAF